MASSWVMQARDARSRVLADHVVLRRLLRDAVGLAHRAQSKEALVPQLRAAIEHLGGELEKHLRYEEEKLAPILGTADAWGSVRVDQMNVDHSGQRAILAALAEDAGAGGRSLDEVVEELEWFVKSFEQDMDDEEVRLLSDTALGLDYLVSDQTDG